MEQTKATIKTRVYPYEYEVDPKDITHDEKTGTYTIHVNNDSALIATLQLQAFNGTWPIEKPLTKWQKFKLKLNRLSRYRLRWVNLDDDFDY